MASSPSSSLQNAGRQPPVLRPSAAAAAARGEPGMRSCREASPHHVIGTVPGPCHHTHAQQLLLQALMALLMPSRAHARSHFMPCSPLSSAPAGLRRPSGHAVKAVHQGGDRVPGPGVSWAALPHAPHQSAAHGLQACPPKPSCQRCALPCASASLPGACPAGLRRLLLHHHRHPRRPLSRRQRPRPLLWAPLSAGWLAAWVSATGLLNILCPLRVLLSIPQLHLLPPACATTVHLPSLACLCALAALAAAAAFLVLRWRRRRAAPLRRQASAAKSGASHGRLASLHSASHGSGKLLFGLEEDEGAEPAVSKLVPEADPGGLSHLPPGTGAAPGNLLPHSYITTAGLAGQRPPGRVSGSLPTDPSVPTPQSARWGPLPPPCHQACPSGTHAPERLPGSRCHPVNTQVSPPIHGCDPPPPQAPQRALPGVGPRPHLHLHPPGHAAPAAQRGRLARPLLRRQCRHLGAAGGGAALGGGLGGHPAGQARWQGLVRPRV